MEITVEFVGVARVLTKTSKTVFQVSEGSSYQDILRKLGNEYPVLVDQMIDMENGVFIGSNMFSKDGKKMIRPNEMKGSPKEGEHLILMSVLAGG